MTAGCREASRGSAGLGGGAVSLEIVVFFLFLLSLAFCILYFLLFEPL